MLMFRPARHIIFFILLFISSEIYSQGLTGTWEGVMGGEFIQVNITQKGGELCGYTYDYVLGNRRDYCIAYFKGGYDERNEAWVITGVSFIENSGSHNLMRVRLWNEEGDSRNMLHAIVAVKSGLSYLSRGRGDLIELKKVGRTPAKLPDLPPCFPEPPKPAEATVKKIESKPSPEKPAVSKPVPAKPVPAVPKPAPVKAVPKPLPKQAPVKPVETKKVSGDTMLLKGKKKPVPAPPTTQSDKQVVQKMSSRKKTEFSHLVVDVKSIKISVYDNGIIDGDTVSIFYNGKLLEGKKRISEKALVINLELDENVARHEITLFAENLGSIPPNTALIIVTAGDKRYELHSSASLEENAVLVVEYKPK